MAIVLDGNNLTTSGLLNALPAQNTTSGTYVDFTGIPSGVNRVTLVLAGVSYDAAVNLRIQLGTSGGVTTSGYTTSSGYFGTTQGAGTSSSGFDTYGWASAANLYYGIFHFYHVGSNIWVGTMTFHVDGQAYQSSMSGKIALSSTLDRVRLTTTSGSSNFDAGVARVFYE